MALESNVGEVKAALEAAATEAMQAGADLLLEKSNQLVPVVTGRLRSTGTARASGTEAVVGYSAPYAIKHHERLNFARQGSGQSKYLETAFHANASTILEEIAATYRKALGQ